MKQSRGLILIAGKKMFIPTPLETTSSKLVPKGFFFSFFSFLSLPFLSPSKGDEPRDAGKSDLKGILRYH